MKKQFIIRLVGKNDPKAWIIQYTFFLQEEE